MWVVGPWVIVNYISRVDPKGGPNYKACAATKHTTNQGLQLLRVCTDQGQKLGVRKGSGKDQEKRNKTPIIYAFRS